jgi:hypothetical protein
MHTKKSRELPRYNQKSNNKMDLRERFMNMWTELN